MEIRDRIKTYVKANLARDHADVDLETESLVDTGIIDSLGIMKLVEFIEKELSVKLPDEDLLPENFDTLDTIAALIRSKKR